MSHFAQIVNGIVTEVISAEQDFINTLSNPSQWLQTSYNTKGNVHYGQNGQPDGGIALRGNYAGVGYTYDATHDVFYAPQPFSSWTLNQTTWLWESPVQRPNDGKSYSWDEVNQNWAAL